MKVLLEEGVLENCTAMGDYLFARLERLRARYPFIKTVRGRGLILGMELTIEGGEIVKKALQRGLLINCTVGKVLRFLPPLIVTREEIDEAMDDSRRHPGGASNRSLIRQKPSPLRAQRALRRPYSWFSTRDSVFYPVSLAFSALADRDRIFNLTEAS